jgi:hypothetical protein
MIADFSFFVVSSFAATGTQSGCVPIFEKYAIIIVRDQKTIVIRRDRTTTGKLDNEDL